MLNRKYFPHERNHYYYGKLLTTKDFEAEQKYFNDKRRLHNRLTCHNGIAAGLGVVMADDLSIILQAGCAYDSSGREIVVPQTQVVKLSTIDGYTQLASVCAYLGIAYHEQFADEVHCVMSGNENGITYNKMTEQYKLILTDKNNATEVFSPIDDFITRMPMYSDGNVELWQCIPKFAPRGCEVVVRVEIRNVAGGTGEYSFSYKLASPGLQNDQGVEETDIFANHIRLVPGENKCFYYTLTPQDYIWGGNSSVTLSANNLVIGKNDEIFSLNEIFEAKLRPVNQSVTELCLSQWYSAPMDKALDESYDQALWIAKIDLIRKDNQIIIDKIQTTPFGQYSYNAQQAMLLRALDDYFPSYRKGASVVQTMLPRTQTATAEVLESTGVTAVCGAFDMPLGLGKETKEPMLSSEIMHGLGTGPVYVEVGVEYITVGKSGESSEIILGDASIFQESGMMKDHVYGISTAVKVLPERGTFIVGVKLKELTDLISLRMRWFAVHTKEIGKLPSVGREGERYILVNPDTIIISPKETAHISPVFINMPTEACNFRMMDAGGGMIDNNGVYTAPAREGVYEIRVEAISDPTVYTHVFAIVSQKRKKEKKDQNEQ